MLKIGLTGGIGSGKSTVAKVFELLGIPVFYADLVAKELMQTDDGLKQFVIKHFGPETYENGILNKPFLASKVFNDPKKLELLNTLVHPVTIQAAENWFRQQKAPYAIKEAALLFESGTATGLDAIIGVTAPVALRIHRVMQRDRVAREQVLERMKHQIEESLKMKLCTYVLSNDEQQLLIPKILTLHQTLLSQSETPSLLQ